MSLNGARYLHIHVPCPLGWGSDPAHTIKVARMAVESGLFPLFEARSGAVVNRTPIRRKVPVERYLELQSRFNHLFTPRRNDAAIAAIQAIADENIATYGLIDSTRP
jgi:pyruvate ferredoxin oxidoreductase beta subunit